MRLLEDENQFQTRISQYNMKMISLRMQFFQAATFNQESSILDCFHFKQDNLPRWGLTVKESEKAARNAALDERRSSEAYN